jgi:hypothetical protein
METDYKGKYDKLARSSETPDIKELVLELQRSVFHGSNLAETSENDDLRFCKWDGQSHDGKKHSEMRDDGKPALPFEGASDVRIRLIDRVINEYVALFMNAWKSSQINVTGVTVDDGPYAKSITTLLNHIVVNRMRSELRSELEMWAQWALQYGWSVMHVTWEQVLGLRPQRVTYAEIEQAVSIISQSDPSSPAARLLDNIKNPDEASIAASIIKQVLPLAKDEELVQLIDDLRENGEGKIYVETVVKNLPSVTALKPYDDIAFPPETIELQKSRVIFRRLFMNEVDIRVMVGSDGWDEAAADEAIKTAGNNTWFNNPAVRPRMSEEVSDPYLADNLVEIVYAYVRQVDEENKPCIYYTVFCPNCESDNLYLKHEKLDYAHGMYPFVALRSENVRKAFSDARGVTEILMTEQAELKAQHDALRDRASMETVPPMLVKRRALGVNKIGPGIQIPVTSGDDFAYLAPPTGSPALAFNLIQQVEKNAANYYGLISELIPQTKSQLIQQVKTDAFLEAVTDIYTMVVQLSLQYMQPEEIERIVGMQIPYGIRDIAERFDFEVKFDVRNIDNEYVMKKLQSIMQFVIPLDTGGVIDRTKLVKMLVEAISPDIAKEVVIDQASASQKMYNEIQSDVVKMLLGLEPQYVENDPTAPTKLQYLQDIMSKSTKAQQIVQSDQMAQMLVNNYAKNLQMSVMQQQNKQIGRTGVTPVLDKVAQEGMPQQ